MKHKIYFPQFDKEAEISKGRTILDYAKELEIPINSSCGGLGICKECRIAIEKGQDVLNKRTEPERELDKNERLACQTIIKDSSFDVYVKILHYGYLQILAKGKDKRIELNPLTRKVDNKIIFDNQEIDNYRGHIYGIAADIGTTTVVLQLMDLENGDCICTEAFENPQRIIDGNNVISRIAYDREKPGKLGKDLIYRINEKIRKMPCDEDKIYEMVIVGNSTMRDIFFGLDVQTLGVFPFKSITELIKGSTFLNKKAHDFPLNIYKNGNIYGAPLISSHVGADTTAVCLSSGLFDTSNEVAMAIDIGTNGEVVLKSHNKIIATSCAAGPALEPMPALRGTIQKISLNNEKTEWKTIGNIEPLGICGSGIIDLLGELIKNKKMDGVGYLIEGKIFKITDKIRITQNEIKGENGLMWSKAAISLGIKALLEKAGIGTDNLDRVYLAGSFGAYINKENARRIGLVPAVPLEKIVQVGNAAAQGAKEMLLSKKRRKLAQKSVERIEHIELASIPNYGRRLMLEEQNFKELKV
ncbi:MAG: ASKHA domain-containing protein [Candidatus Aerophobetes bacterium]|nr:ASKHA domain-containing protein [Candidatus Aerophobetes bacterium]